jgi:hypothetical protein
MPKDMKGLQNFIKEIRACQVRRSRGETAHEGRI